MKLHYLGAVILAFVTASTFGSSYVAAQATRADAEKDPVLKAMLTELDRNKSELQLRASRSLFSSSTASRMSTRSTPRRSSARRKDRRAHTAAWRALRCVWATTRRIARLRRVMGR